MANVGDKFIIELEAKVKRTFYSDYKNLFKIKDCEILMSEDVLDKFEGYDGDEKANADFDAGYKEGLADAWQANRKIYEYDKKRMQAIFGKDCEIAEDVYQRFLLPKQ